MVRPLTSRWAWIPGPSFARPRNDNSGSIRQIERVAPAGDRHETFHHLALGRRNEQRAGAAHQNTFRLVLILAPASWSSSAARPRMCPNASAAALSAVEHQRAPRRCNAGSSAMRLPPLAFLDRPRDRNAPSTKPASGAAAAEQIREECHAPNPSSRRALVQGRRRLRAAALGMPAISRAQSDAIKIGHLTPRTGFLGPLGDFAVHGHPARRRRDQRGGRRERPQDRAGAGRLGQSADRLGQGRAPGRARQGRDDHRRDFVRLRARDRAGRQAHQDGVHQHRL